MELNFQRLKLRKRHPLEISRGTVTESENLLLEVSENGKVGLGETAFPGYGKPQSAEASERELRHLARELNELIPWQVSKVEETAKRAGIGSAALSALVNACWDWTGKAFGVPLYRVLGYEPVSEKTSITVGINPPEVVRKQVPFLLSVTGTDRLKIKLGSTNGIEADKAQYLAAKEAAPFGAKLRVDANGGWSLGDAKRMAVWLETEGCEYLEQPLHYDADGDLPDLFKNCPLPIFLDESVFTSSDVARLAHCCHGVNVKLTKCGGISEAVRIVHTARALGLKTMIGCFSESSLSIAAGAAIGCLFDYIDLDSHLNLDPDPAEGLILADGRILPSEAPGLGVRLR